MVCKCKKCKKKKYYGGGLEKEDEKPISPPLSANADDIARLKEQLRIAHIQHGGHSGSGLWGPWSDGRWVATD